MFVVSKILGFLLQPSFAAALCILIGLMLVSTNLRRSLGLKLAWGGLGYLIIFGIVPLGNVLILPLEQHFAGMPRPKPTDGISGIIILGGFEDGYVSAGRGQLTVNESAERLTEGVRLARELPDTKVLFSGGVGALWHADADATQPVADYMKAIGIDAGRLLLEGLSRNTIENASFSAKLVNPQPGERWVLVTSAYHMPRAVSLFRNAGFTVQPWPVDFRTRGWQDVWRPFDRLPQGHQRIDVAVNEWLGLFLLRLAGTIGRIFPAR